MVGGQDLIDYSILESRLNVLESELGEIIAHFAKISETVHDSKKLDKRIQRLAKDASKIAKKSKDSYPDDLSAHAQTMRILIQDAEEMIELLPHTRIKDEEHLWRARLEKTRKDNERLKDALLSMQTMDGRPRRQMAEKIDKALQTTEKRVVRLKTDIIHKQNIHDHAVHKRLRRLRDAMHNAHGHIQNRVDEKRKSDNLPKSKEMARNMLNYFRDNRQGRMFIDHDSLELTDKNRVFHLENDDILKQALGLIFSKTSMHEHYQNVLEKQSTICATYQCIPSFGGFVVQMDAGERKIGEDHVSFRPFRARIAF